MPDYPATLGDQIQTNIAFQYHLLNVLWRQIEMNWTSYADGHRGGLNQVYPTPGLVIGRFKVANGLMFTCGGGYQLAVAPAYRPSSLAPAYEHASIAEHLGRHHRPVLNERIPAPFTELVRYLEKLRDSSRAARARDRRPDGQRS